MSVSPNTENTDLDEETPGDSLHDAGLAETGLPKMGEILQQKREEKNLSLEDVSSRLRLSVRQIKALEANNFSMFPEAMMTRGFIRNYARFLEIDAEALLSAYRAHVPNDAPPSLSIHSANVMLPNGNRHGFRKYLVILIVLAIAGAGWLIYTQYIPWQKLQFSQAKSPENTSSSGETLSNQADGQTSEGPAQTTEPMPEVALPLAERESQQPQEPQKSIAEPLPGQAQAAVPASNSPDQAATAGMAASSAPLVENAPSPSIVRIKQDASIPVLKLQFSFSEESWVSVTDHDGNQVLNRTKPAGSRDQVEAKPPLKVVIGNAAGSQLLYQGRPLDLTPYTRLNVARLTLDLEQ